MDNIVEKFLIEKLREEIKKAKDEAKELGRMNPRCRTILHNEEWEKVMDLIEKPKPGTGASVKEMRREKLYYLLNLTAEWLELSKKLQEAECCDLLKKNQKLNPKSLLPFDEIGKKLNQFIKDLDEPLQKGKGEEESQHRKKGAQDSVRAPAQQQQQQTSSSSSSPKIPQIYRWSSRKTTPFHGFGDKLQVMERLLLKRDGSKAIGISGVAGVGKTALAQEAYNHPPVKDQFPIKMWLCMSKQQKIDIEDPMKRMLGCLGFEAGVIEKLAGKNKLEVALRRQLSRARYLIVLDDVWAVEKEDREKNKKLVSLLTDCKEGKVVVTSRSPGPEVEKVVGPKNVQRLSRLEDSDSCWEIFKDASAAGVTTEMEELRPKIVDKCEGLPLMAKLLGKYAINA